MAADEPSSVHRILALDPGVTTGICRGLLDVEAKTLELDPAELKLTIGQFYEVVRNHVSLAEGNIHVIYETFSYRNNPRAGLDLTPVRLIGVLELLAEWYSDQDVTFYPQTAAMGKGFYTDEWLKRRGSYIKGAKHSRDAIRHLLHWLHFREGSQYVDIDKLTISIK